MKSRVFVIVGGRAWLKMRCEFCNALLNDVEGHPYQQKHPLPPENKPFLHSEKSYQLWRTCPNIGKTFEYPCAIEVT